MTKTPRNFAKESLLYHGFTGLAEAEDVNLSVYADIGVAHAALTGQYGALLQQAANIIQKFVDAQPVTSFSPYHLVEARILLKRLYGEKNAST